MALTKISTGGVKDDAVTAGKIPANAVGSSEIADDAVVQATIADDAVDEARLQISNAGSNGQFLQKQSGNTGGLTWAAAGSYTHPNHSGEVTSTGDGATVISDDTVDEANLKISNAGSDGQYLQKQSGNTGGLTWATVSTSDATKMPLSGGAFTGAVTSNSTIGDSIGNLRRVIRNAQSSTYTLVASDAGKHIYANNAPTITVPASVFASGDVITIINASTSNMTISRASGVSLYLPGGADANRTLGQYGICTLLHTISDVFWITGAELS